MIPALLADTVATVTVADRSELRSRFTQGSDPGLDLTTMPSGRFELHGRAVTLEAGYEPILTLRDMQQKGFATPEALQRWTAGLGWRARHVRLALYEVGTLGDQNYTYLVQPVAVPGQAAAPPQLLPGQAGTLAFASSQTVLTAIAPMRRAILSTTTSLYAGGGTDDLAKELIPFQVTPRQDVALDYGLDRSDRLVTTIGAQTATFMTRVCDLTTGGPRTPFRASATAHEAYRSNWIGVCRSDVEQVDGLETWHRAIGRRTDLSLAAGGAVARSYVEGQGAGAPFSIVGPRTRFYPMAEANLVHRLEVARPDASRIEASARLAPIIDMRLGTLDPRLMLTVRDITRAFERATIRLELSFAQTVPFDDPNAITLLMWSGEAAWRISKRFDAGVALRGAWQQQQGLVAGAGGGFVTAQASLLFAYHEPTKRLWP